MNRTKYGLKGAILMVLLICATIGNALGEEEDDLFFDDRITSSDWIGYLGYSFGLRYDNMAGFTKYHIDFPGGASELEFPVKSNLLGLSGTISYRTSPDEIKDTARLTVNWLTSSAQAAGKMKDSDWIDDDVTMLWYYGRFISANHSGLDIYSESDAEVEANFLDVNYYYNLYPEKFVGLGPVIGYIVQDFKYDIKNARQVGYGPYDIDEFNQTVDGKVLDYKVKYDIIYLGLNTEFEPVNNLGLGLMLGFSPWTKSDDRDDHLVRNPPKISIGHGEGKSYLAKAQGQWAILENLSLIFGGQYLKIDTKGKQQQKLYDVPLYYYDGTFAGFAEWDLGEVDDKITSTTYSLSLGIAYKF